MLKIKSLSILKNDTRMIMKRPINIFRNSCLNSDREFSLEDDFYISFISKNKSISNDYSQKDIKNNGRPRTVYEIPKSNITFRRINKLNSSKKTKLMKNQSPKFNPKQISENYIKIKPEPKLLYCSFSFLTKASKTNSNSSISMIRPSTSIVKKIKNGHYPN